MPKTRFFKATTNYPNYIQSMLNRHPELKTLDYKSAMERYFYDAYGWADFCKRNLEATGKFECEEVVMNIEPLQKKWAQENKVTYSEQNWKNEILVAQIKAFQPDVLFLIDLYNDNSITEYIKREVPSIKLLMGWDGILWHKPETYKYCDLILTCVADTAQYYKKHGKSTYLYKFGFEPDVLNRLTRLDKAYNVSFTGSLIPHPDYHLSRLHAVAEMQRRVNMDVWAGSLPKDWHLLTPSRLWYTVRHRQWKIGRDLYQVGRKNRGEVFGLDMFNVLYNSRIVFNTHGDNSPRQAANMRMTEVTGSGALLLTDWKENISEFFKPDEEIVVYKSIDEAIDKVKNLLKDEKLRASIAAKGQQRTLTEYSYKTRMEELGNFILGLI